MCRRLSIDFRKNHANSLSGKSGQNQCLYRDNDKFFLGSQCEFQFRRNFFLILLFLVSKTNETCKHQSQIYSTI